MHRKQKTRLLLGPLGFALPGVPGEIPTIRLLLATDCSTSSGCPAGLTQKTAEISNRFMLASGYDPASLGIQTDDIFVLSRDGVQIPVTLYSEYGSDGHSPCLLYFHGGGFCTKTSPQYERLMSNMLPALTAESSLSITVPQTGIFIRFHSMTVLMCSLPLSRIHPVMGLIRSGSFLAATVRADAWLQALLSGAETIRFRSGCSF